MEVINKLNNNKKGEYSMDELKKEVEEYKRSGNIERFNNFLDKLDINKNPGYYQYLVENLTSEEAGRLI